MRNMILNFMADKTGGVKGSKRKKAIVIEASSKQNNKVKAFGDQNMDEDDDESVNLGKSKSRKKKERDHKKKGYETQPKQAKAGGLESDQHEQEVARSILKPSAQARTDSKLR